MAPQSGLCLLFVLSVPVACTEAADGAATDLATTSSSAPSLASSSPTSSLSTSANGENSAGSGAGGESAAPSAHPDDSATAETGDDVTESSDVTNDSDATSDANGSPSDGEEMQDDTEPTASNSSSNGAGAPGSAGENTGSASGGEAGSSSDAGSSAGGSGAGGATNAGLSSFTLAVIGSSTSAGEGASDGNGWVNLLSDALEETVQVPFNTENLSVGGYASPNLLPGSGDGGNIDDAIDTEPNLIIVALAGSNDLSAGTSQATFLERMHTLRDTALDAGIPLFFVSTAPKDLSDDEQQALKDWSDAMAAEFTSCWVPGNDAYSPCFIGTFDALANDSLGIDSMYSAGDGIHLNDEGHAVIFEAARAVAEAYVCSQVQCL